MATPTPEEQAKIDLVRILVGDTPGSIFYPIMSDDEYYALLELSNWDVLKAARRAAISISLKLSMVNYRERTGDIEVWNNASIEYKKALKDFLDENATTLPGGLIPYAAGISKEDICARNRNPDAARSPLAQISPCTAWWTTVKGYPCCEQDWLVFNIRV